MQRKLITKPLTRSLRDHKSMYLRAALVFARLSAVIGVAFVPASMAATSTVALRTTVVAAVSGLQEVPGGISSTTNLYQKVSDGVTFATANDATYVQTPAQFIHWERAAQL